MADFALAGASKLITIGYSSGSTNGTTITAPGGTNSKGSYTQLTSSLSNDICGFWLYLAYGASGAGYLLIDIAVGAAASETVIVPDIIWYRTSGYSNLPNRIWCPISIPAGTRIAARYQVSNNSSPDLNLHMLGVVPSAQTNVGYARGLNYGSNTADSTGATLTSGASNTKGSWVELSASTTRRHSGLIVGAVEASANRYAIDVGIGAASSEVVVLPDWLIQGNGTPVYGHGGNYGFVPLVIPAGSRLSARVASSAATQTCEFFCIGV